MEEVENLCVYTLVDEVMDLLSPKELADYIYHNNKEYAEALEFSIGVDEISELCNDALIEEDKDTKLI